MNTSIAESLKLFFAIMLLTIFLNVIAIVYNINQVNSFQREATEYIRQEGALDAKTRKRINTILADNYRNMFQVENSPITTVSSKTPAYQLNGINQTYALENHDSQLFKNNDLITPKDYINPGQDVKTKGTLGIPVYKRKSNSTKLVSSGQVLTLAKTSNGLYFDKSKLLKNYQVHPYGAPIYYKIHMRVPLVMFGAFKTNKIAIDKTYEVQTTSQTDTGTN